MRVRAVVALGLALAIPLGAFAVARQVKERFDAFCTTPSTVPAAWPVVFEIPRGQRGAVVAQRLREAGLVSSRRALRVLLFLSRNTGKLKAGEYRFEQPPSPLDLMETLVSGRVWLHAYTVREGLDLRETASLLAPLGGWSEESLRATFGEADLVRDLDPAAPDLEGYLFPETYHLPKGAPAKDLAASMASNFRHAWKELDGDRHAAALGLSFRQVATLASLVEKETRVPEERPLVASVYWNRLRKGMLLQSDPTVVHGLSLDGLWHGGTVLYGDLHHESPYNTYLHAGLPPGPICSFGRESLAAALEPAATDYLFFVATGTGGHRFAATEAEHERNVLLYRRMEREARGETR